ncbi:MAG: glycosyltransferase [Candidatus Thermoplasmatota archaeon]|nr:glycosyltransferase [Candidatus Thermoplasmatota archaeon]
MNIIYSLCSWGLGHATRSLPIIRKLIKENHNLTIISSDRSLQLLQHELGPDITYIDIPDYPMLVSENTRQFIAKSMFYWPLFIKRMEDGLQQLQKILKNTVCDRIISDGRYDMYSKTIPSYFISHQMRIMNPLRIHLFERGSETFNKFFFKRFKEVIIPDFKENNLSGDLSHNLKKIDENKLHYVGILSDFSQRNVKKDIDYFISLSGPEPQRSILERRIIDQVKDLPGSIVMSLGKTEEKDIPRDESIETYSYLSKEKREEFLNRSELVISRSGYSTIMDLAVIGTKALMIPTPGQIEQEYLAAHLKKTNTCHTTTQDSLQLVKDTKLAEKTNGFTKTGNVEKTVENVLDILFAE